MTRLQDFLNSPLKQVTAGGNGKAGDLFGVELECEGKNVDWDGSVPELLKQWAPHNDGSLRAHHGSCQEWVFNGPVTYKASLVRISTLFEFFKKRQSKLVCSNRTSTHVHFNMGDKSVYQLVNLFILFTVLEDILDRYCGEDRNGNLFCLSSRHANEQVRWISDACFKRFDFTHIQENWRYCSLNIAAINKFGTVEFRAMRGCEKEQEVKDWLGIVNDLCQYACYEMRNPVTLIEQVSLKTPVGILQDIFKGPNFRNLTRDVPEAYINASVYEGLRLVQMLAYKIGTEFDAVKMKGRDFWASFAEDNPDAPQMAQPEPARAPRPPRGQRANPFGQARVEGVFDPFRNVAPQAWGEPVAPLPEEVEAVNPGINQLIERERRRIREQQVREWWNRPPEPEEPIA